MPITFLNAPLVELIAEIRWLPCDASGTRIPPPQVSGNAPFVAFGASNEFEEFFMRFGASAARLGYPMAERLVPPDFPLMMAQPVYRFRQSSQGGLKSLYQVGPGIFTANAVPPYQTWDQFSHVVQNGVEAMLESRSSGEQDAPFIGTSLRYIDAFGPTLRCGMDVSEFMERVLGIEVRLPAGLTGQLAPGTNYKPSIQAQIPMAAGMIMSVAVGEGMANNEPVIILDTTVATTTPVAANLDAVMRAMNLARNSIHDAFFDLTGPIRELMKPQGAD